jgi:hypothetical protein
MALDNIEVLSPEIHRTNFEAIIIAKELMNVNP